MDDGMVYGHSSTVCLTGVVARVESLRSRQAESERHPVCDGAGVNGLSPIGDAPQFESMLAESFGDQSKEQDNDY